MCIWASVHPIPVQNSATHFSTNMSRPLVEGIHNGRLVPVNPEGQPPIVVRFAYLLDLESAMSSK